MQEIRRFRGANGDDSSQVWSGEFCEVIAEHVGVEVPSPFIAGELISMINARKSLTLRFSQAHERG